MCKTHCYRLQYLSFQTRYLKSITFTGTRRSSGGLETQGVHEHQQTLGYLREQYQCHDYFLFIWAFGIKLLMRLRAAVVSNFIPLLIMLRRDSPSKKWKYARRLQNCTDTKEENELTSVIRTPSARQDNGKNHAMQSIKNKRMEHKQSWTT